MILSLGGYIRQDQSLFAPKNYFYQIKLAIIGDARKHFAIMYMILRKITNATIKGFCFLIKSFNTWNFELFFF